MSEAPTLDRSRVTRYCWISGLVGVAAWVACIVGAVFDPDQFFRAYLAAYSFYWGLALGAMALLMIYHLTGGAWGFLVRRLLEAQMKTIPLLAILFTPIAFGVHHLYLWAQPDFPHKFKHLRHLQFYMDLPFFWYRVAAYFIVWCILAWLLSRWSKQQDDSDDARLPWKCMNLSGPGLVIYGITIHFASIDWIMSVQTLFHTTIFGPLTVGGQIISAYALAVAVFCLLPTSSESSDVFSLRAMTDIGSLLLTLLTVWAYLAWFQFMLSWIANVPSDVVWYLARTRGGWKWVVVSLVVLHFAVPFIALLFRGTKQRPALLGSIAGLIVFMHLVYMYYQVVPPYGAGHMSEHWMDFLTPIAIGGIWLAAFGWLLGRLPLLAVYDINREHALQLRKLDEEEAAREEALIHG